jgi:hypothetical protein
MPACAGMTRPAVIFRVSAACRSLAKGLANSPMSKRVKRCDRPIDGTIARDLFACRLLAAKRGRSVDCMRKFDCTKQAVRGIARFGVRTLLLAKSAHRQNAVISQRHSAIAAKNHKLRAVTRGLLSPAAGDLRIRATIAYGATAVRLRWRTAMSPEISCSEAERASWNSRNCCARQSSWSGISMSRVKGCQGARSWP